MRTRDVADFIRARLDEDEATARVALLAHEGRAWQPAMQPAGFGHQDVCVESAEDWCVADVTNGSLTERSAVAAHIARHDPAWVLADIAAKREIVAWIGDYDAEPDGSAWGILGHLAALYADHPGYRQEWRSALDDSEGGS